MLFSIDGTFIVQLINFAIFFAVVNAIFIKPVGEAIAERRNYIDSLTADYDGYAELIAKMEAQAEAQRAAARRDADVLLTAARAAIAREVDAIGADYAGRTARIVEQAHATVEHEVTRARSSEDRLVGELADDMLERALA
ncbi:MAG TPA: ATP synthase F0 subunit B [Candidatus Binatia bacterium]|nr:ATP synthase F0 subunit B [Candidatus Binatia bacterium]